MQTKELMDVSVAKIEVFINRHLTVGIILLLMVGCSRIGSYSYSPHRGIKLIVQLKKLKAHPEHKSTFLHFDIQVENNAPDGYYFHPGQLRAKLNGEINGATYYDSLASVETEKRELSRGKSTYHLYFVFPEAVGTTEIKDFHMVNFGLSPK
jgi:hypothetical protein